MGHNANFIITDGVFECDAGELTLMRDVDGGEFVIGAKGLPTVARATRRYSQSEVDPGSGPAVQTGPDGPGPRPAAAAAAECSVALQPQAATEWLGGRPQPHGSCLILERKRLSIKLHSRSHKWHFEAETLMAHVLAVDVYPKLKSYSTFASISDMSESDMDVNVLLVVHANDSDVTVILLGFAELGMPCQGQRVLAQWE